jgi:hypothetical protein
MRTTQQKKTVQISNELHKRIAAFKPVIETVMDEKYEMEDFVAGLLDNGINLLLEKLLGNVPANALWQSLQQLGTKYPVEVTDLSPTRSAGATKPARQNKRTKSAFGLIHEQAKDAFCTYALAGGRPRHGSIF